MTSLIVVNYRSSDLAIAAIRSARMASTEALEIVVVDNSCEPAEAEALARHADRLVVSPANIGYAAAINRGRKECRGDILIVANPDVIFAAGAIDALVGAFEDPSIAVAGPALFWDDAHRWLLPPSDLRTFRQKLDDVLATRSRLWSRWRDRRRIRQRMRFWSAADTTPVQAISGAVMAIRAVDFDALGGFDESFPLYFEELDFVRRAWRKGRRVVYVPRSRCRHLYNQSAGANSAYAATAYTQSEMHYLSKWSSPFLARLLKRLERVPRAPHLEGMNRSIELPPRDVLVEASPLADFATAAGHFPDRLRLDLPGEVANAYRGEVLYLRVIDRRTLQPLATYARYRS